MVSDALGSQNKTLLFEKITDKYSYFSKQVECIFPYPASLKINAFHLQPTLKLVLGLEQFAVSRILGFFHWLLHIQV